MKLSISETLFDENSTERILLCFNGVSYGTYSFGLYSRWYINRVEKGGRTIPDVECFVAGLLYKNFNIDPWEPGAEKLIDLQIKDGDVGAWFEEYMENEIC